MVEVFVGHVQGIETDGFPRSGYTLSKFLGAHLWGAVTAGLPRPGDTWTKFLTLVYGNENGHAKKIWVFW